MVPASSEESPSVTREVVSIPTLPQQVDDKAVARKMKQIDEIILKLKTATPSRGDQVPPAQAPAVVAAESLEAAALPPVGAQAAASVTEAVVLTWTVPTAEVATTAVTSRTDGLGIIRPTNNESPENSELGHMFEASLSRFPNSETEEPPDEDEKVLDAFGDEDSSALAVSASASIAPAVTIPARPAAAPVVSGTGIAPVVPVALAPHTDATDSARKGS